MAEVAVGVDWHPRGWVAVVLRPGAAPLEVLAGSDLAALVGRVPDAAWVGVDMPIGLPTRVRPADVEARAFVGPRWRTVFMTPPAAVLVAGSYAEANTVSQEIVGKGLSKQAWSLRHNIGVVGGRRRILAEAGIVVPDALGEAGRVPPPDVLDAAAAAWSARRCARGRASRSQRARP